MRLSGFGGVAAAECRVAAPRDEAGLRARLAGGPLIARGAGLAYGDSAINPNLTLSTRRMARMLGFEDGVLTAEAGVVLADIVAAFLPRGWLPPVMPGTGGVTLGGAIAADVHGKNHRRDGSFGRHVRWIELMQADGTVRRVSGAEAPGLAAATIGGMGLTGVMLRAAIALERVETGWLRQRTEAVPDAAAAMAALELAGGWHYAIAWLDCLADSAGRGLVHLGERAALSDLGPREAADRYAMRRRRTPEVPATPPLRLVRAAPIRAMNALRYRRAASGPVEELADWRGFFFPLDALAHWNRLYGPPGLVQHQCVVPLAEAERAIPALVRAAAGRSMLATLKRFGRGSEGGLSFPMEGFSLALDFPATAGTFDLLRRLDRIVLDHGGRFYLAKDARLDRATLAAAEPRLAAFRALREQTGAAGTFASAQSERLGL